jgi:hypothetical protein
MSSLIFISCASTKTGRKDSCQLPDPIVIMNKGDILFQYWELPKDFIDKAENNFEVDERLILYRNKLNSLYDTDPVALLESAVKYEEGLDQKNNRVIFENIDKIRKINCLETKLIAIQNSRKDLLKEPTEFIAFKLSRGEKYKLYYFTSNIAGVRSLGFIHKEIEESLKNGWKLIYNLHNHNFFIDEKKYRGTVAPSSADAWVFKVELKNYGLQKALVTNGFHTVELTPAMIKKLSTGNMRMKE